jgi:hypothetical protein
MDYITLSDLHKKTGLSINWLKTNARQSDPKKGERVGLALPLYPYDTIIDTDLKKRWAEFSKTEAKAK